WSDYFSTSNGLGRRWNLGVLSFYFLVGKVCGTINSNRVYETTQISISLSTIQIRPLLQVEVKLSRQYVAHKLGKRFDISKVVSQHSSGFTNVHRDYRDSTPDRLHPRNTI